MAKYLDYSGLSYLWGKIRAYVGAATGSNYNLLDNAYFVGGGSQSGNEVFPINSRGKTYYEAVNGAYYFDRWKSDSPWASPVKCGFQNEGVVLAGDVTPGYPTAYAQLTQVISNPPVGKTVTLSILTDNVSSDNEGSPPFLLTNGNVWTPITIGLTKVTFVWASGVSSISIILPDGETSAASLRMQAIKLEIGEFSTIENDSAPDYGVELVRCIYSKADTSDTYANTGFGRSNDNLLDNAYFVGGGSQLGDGVFPINQRGQTTYNTAAWNMDRWYGACTLYADHIHIPAFIQQNASYPLNTPLTMSVMLADGTILSGTNTFTETATQQYFYTDGNNIQLVRAAGGMPMIWTGVGVDVKAAKLEVGTVSTLANDPPPNYWTELQKCKARLRFVPLTRCPIVFASGNAYLDLNGCEMEGAPIASLYSNEGAVVGSSGVMASITSVTNIAINHNVPLLQFNLTGTINDQVGQIFNTIVQLSSEL